MHQPASTVVTETAPRYDPESPFVDRYDLFEAQEAPLPVLSSGLESPFLSEYTGEAAIDPTAAARGEALVDLFDPELEEALEALALEAAGMYAEQLDGLPPGAEHEASADRVMQEWIGPLQTEADRMLDAMSRGLEGTDVASLQENELEDLLQGFAPTGEATGNPVFEEFLGRLFNKAKAVAQRAASAVRRGAAAVGRAVTRVLPVDAVLQRLRQLVRPLLEAVLRHGIDRLPAPLRPTAARLSASILREGMEESAVVSPSETLYEELDLRLAGLLSVSEVEEAELIVQEARDESAQLEPAALAELDAARGRFVQGWAQLERGQDPTPLLEDFVPAVIAAVQQALPLIRLGITLVGRQNVVNFLSQNLAGLIEPHVGKEASAALSRAIVEAGMLMLMQSIGELSQEETRDLAGSAIASTLEDTVRTLALLPAEAFEDSARLQAETQEAFAQSAARNFPPSTLRPNLPQIEASGNATWVAMPRPRRHRYFYKRYTKTFDVTVTPQIARTVRSFGGVSLESFLRDRMKVALPVRAQVVLIEATARTWLSRVSLFELGNRGRAGYSQLHPLTPEVAGTLLQEPGLGKPVPPGFLATRDRIEVGQRFYYLKLPRPGGPAVIERPSQLNLTLDLRQGRDEMRAALYLNDREARAVADKLSQRQDIAGAMNLFAAAAKAALGSALDIASGRNVHVLREVESEELLGPALALGRKLLAGLPTTVRAWLVTQVLDALQRAAAELFRASAQAFVTATNDPRPGVTVIVTLKHPGMVRLLTGALGGAPVALATITATAIATGRIEIVPGFRRG